MKYFYGKEMSKEFLDNKINVIDNKVKIKKNKLIYFSKVSNNEVEIKAKFEVKQSKCIICQHKKFFKDSNIFGINYLMCQKCSHVFVDRRLSDKSIEKYYSNESTDSLKTYSNKKVKKIRQDILEPKIKFVKKFSNGKKWLDVGSADGTALSVCKKMGFDVNGIELNENSRKYAKKINKVELYQKSLEEFVKENKTKFDVISFFTVLEHLPNPISSLKTAHSILKKNGIIAIDVPNYNSISTYVQKLKPSLNRHLAPHSHIMMFSQKSLEYAMKRTGFRPIAIWYWGMDIVEFINYLIKKDKNFENSQMLEVLIKNANEIQNIFDKQKIGDEMLIIGGKV